MKIDSYEVNNGRVIAVFISDEKRNIKQHKYEPARPHGEWKRGLDNSKHWVWKCKCGCMERIARNFCPDCGASMQASYRQVTGKLNSEIEKSKSEIVPDYRDGWKLKEGDLE